MKPRLARRPFFALSLVLMLTLSASTISSNPRTTANGDAGKAMQELKLLDLDGKPYDAAKLKGSVLVLDFWATWCKPCINEIPELNRLQEKYASKGLKVVGVTMASGAAPEVKPFVGRFKMQYTVLMGDDGQSYDLNIYSYPTTYLVTRDWKVRAIYKEAGPRKTRDLEAEILKLLD